MLWSIAMTLHIPMWGLAVIAFLAGAVFGFRFAVFGMKALVKKGRLVFKRDAPKGGTQ